MKKRTKQPAAARRTEAPSGKSVLTLSQTKAKAKTQAAIIARESANEENTPAKRKRGRQGKFTLKDLTYPDQRSVRFPVVHGKKTESVELFTSPHCHYLSVEFTDRTSLSFLIEPRFSFMASYEYFKKGKPRAKLWPEIPSHRG
jgi:hypothetical protein